MHEKKSILEFSPWMRGFLMIGGIYNFAWGLFIYNFPQAFFTWISGSKQDFPVQVGYLGMLVIFIAGVYWVAAYRPIKLNYFILFILIAKATGGVIMYYFFLDQQISKGFYFHLLMNDFIWIPPLLFIYLRSRKIAPLLR